MARLIPAWWRGPGRFATDPRGGPCAGFRVDLLGLGGFRAIMRRLRRFTPWPLPCWVAVQQEYAPSWLDGARQELAGRNCWRTRLKPGGRGLIFPAGLEQQVS